jgi:hypothetical protein
VRQVGRSRSWRVAQDTIWQEPYPGRAAGPGLAITCDLVLLLAGTLARVARCRSAPSRRSSSRALGLRIAVAAGAPVRPRTDSPEISYWLVVVEVLLKRWVVRDRERVLIAEVDARGVPGGSRASCLICDCEQSIRRIWNFPDDWDRMDDAKLLALFDAPYVRAEPQANESAGDLVAVSY